ncbi:hypothetical protein FACS1894158_17460 [Betaproteobacteria bacterium]|nr:hypothetical protein FACS1894158_17460 [Betaproteobacteria bacterium]
MDWLTNLNARLSRWALYIAVTGMAEAVWYGYIPTLSISEAWRYILCVIAGVLTISFSCRTARSTGKIEK